MSYKTVCCWLVGAWSLVSIGQMVNPFIHASIMWSNVDHFVHSSVSWTRRPICDIKVTCVISSLIPSPARPESVFFTRDATPPDSENKHYSTLDSRERLQRIIGKIEWDSVELKCPDSFNGAPNTCEIFRVAICIICTNKSQLVRGLKLNGPLFFAYHQVWEVLS